jgi:hypothetical protein
MSWDNSQIPICRKCERQHKGPRNDGCLNKDDELNKLSARPDPWDFISSGCSSTCGGHDGEHATAAGNRAKKVIKRVEK